MARDNLPQSPPRPPAQLSLAPPFVCRETVELLENALAAAQAGELIGAAICVALTRSRFYVDVAGCLRRQPIKARGIVCSLDDELRQLIEDAAHEAPEFSW